MGGDFGRQAGVGEALRAISAPIFAAAWSVAGGRDTLFVHVAAAPQRAALKRKITARLAEIGVANVKIRFHNAGQLSAPKSLERLVARFAGDEIVYDPTEAVARAKAVVAAGRSVRQSLSRKLSGLYYAPRLRTFYVSLNAARIAVGEKFKVAELAAIERNVADAMRDAFAADLDQCPAVRVGFGLPRTHLVAVDSRSVVHWAARAGAALRRLWKPLTVAALFGLGTATAAADGSNGNAPAVSATNLKVTAQGGEVDDEGAWVAGGALTLPLGERFGLQVEGGAAGVDDDTIWGGAAHLFTRNPDKYLLGLFASYAKEDDFDLDATRIGAEAELYLRQISILAQAGYQFSDGFAGVGGDTAFGAIDLRWYATDNLAFTAGGNFQEDVTQGDLSAEFMPGFSALPGLAFNVKGVIGDDDYSSVLGGVTYYFGSSASLKDRHRRQDPESALFNLFQSVEQERAKLDALYGTSAPPPPPG